MQKIIAHNLYSATIRTQGGGVVVCGCVAAPNFNGAQMQVTIITENFVGTCDCKDFRAELSERGRYVEEGWAIVPLHIKMNMGGKGEPKWRAESEEQTRKEFNFFSNAIADAMRSGTDFVYQFPITGQET